MTSHIGTCPPPVLHGVIDDAHLKDMQLRNEARAAELIEQLGPRYCCWNPTPPRTQQASVQH